MTSGSLSAILLFTALTTLVVMGVGLVLAQVFEPKPRGKDRSRR